MASEHGSVTNLREWRFLRLLRNGVRVWVPELNRWLVAISSFTGQHRP